MIDVAPGLIVVKTSIADGRIGVIAGTRVALAVDAGNDDAEGEAALAAARSLGRPIVQLTYTHGHADHALGGTAFVGHDILANEAIAEHMRAQLDGWAARGDESSPALAARLGWPTIMHDEDTTVDLGGRSVQLLHTPGHAPGAMCVFEPDAGILFGGDTIVTAIPPVFRDGDSIVLEATLRRLTLLEIEILVPGHGAVVSGRDAVRTAIERCADYLGHCRAHLDANADLDEEALVEAADVDTFVGGWLQPDRHRNPWRHEQTIRLMRAEQSRTGN